MGNNFYASLIDSIASEKTASEKDAMNIMQSTSNMSVDQMKSLASALTDSYQEKVAQATLEESLMKKRADEEEHKEEHKEDHKEHSEDDGKEKDASNCKSADDDDDDDKDDKDEHHDEHHDGKPYDSDDHHKEKEVDVEVKEEKSADEFTDEELTKIAYEQLEEKLADEGYTLEDYVFTKTADEDTSYFIADKASKLAYLAEQPVLKVADDILECMMSK